MVCNCRNITIGSHANAVAVPIPDHMADYRDARMRAGLSAFVSIDRCIVPQIMRLWSAGIRTYGSCCGHNIGEPFVNVDRADIERMKAMGYAVQFNPCRPGDQDTFALMEPVLFEEASK